MKIFKLTDMDGGTVGFQICHRVSLNQAVHGARAAEATVVLRQKSMTLNSTHSDNKMETESQKLFTRLPRCHETRCRADIVPPSLQSVDAHKSPPCKETEGDRMQSHPPRQEQSKFNKVKSIPCHPTPTYSNAL